MVAIGTVDWLHFECLRISRGIQLGIADQLNCKSWVLTTRRLSFYSTSWITADAFTSTFVPADDRARHIEELHLSFHYPSRARSAFPLLKACLRFCTLRIYFETPNLTSRRVCTRLSFLYFH